MLALRRVLFPTDGSPCADRAFAHAAFLADRHGAELHVLRVVPVTGTEPEPPHGYNVPAGVTSVDITCQAATASEAIVDYARDVDLVVMGTHGRRGVRRLTAGSTTEGVLRHADCPVLAVGMGAEHSDPSAVRRVLVPVDFSDSSAVALAVADGLASLYGARVDALHAAYVPNVPAEYGLGWDFGPAYPGVVANTTDALRTLMREALPAERRGEAVVRVGPPGPTILEEAGRRGAGLLVMPTHGRTGLARLALGSVAEQVLRRAPCPVLALRSHGRGGVARLLLGSAAEAVVRTAPCSVPVAHDKLTAAGAPGQESALDLEAP